MLDSQRIPVAAKERASRAGSVPYYGAAGQVGWIDSALFDEPLVLLGEDGVQFFDPSRAKAYRIDGPAWVNNHAHVLRPRDRVDRRYLEHYLNCFDYRGYANGTTRLKLTQAAMRRIPIALPALSEQRRIVDILEDHLSRLDSALQYLPTGKRTDPLVASTASKALRGVGGAPETIGSIAQEVKNGIFVARASSKPDGVPILRIGAVRSLSLDLEAVGFSRRSSADIRASGSEVAAGDLLFTRYNGNPAYVASCAVVPAEAGLLTYPDKLIRVRMDDTRTLPAFIAIAATYGRTRADLQAHVKTTSGQAGISGRDLKAAEVDVPSLEDQASVVQVVEQALVSARRLASEAERIRVRTKALRSALLTAAFSGRLTGRTSDLDRAEELAT